MKHLGSVANKYLSFNTPNDGSCFCANFLRNQNEKQFFNNSQSNEKFPIKIIVTPYSLIGNGERVRDFVIAPHYLKSDCEETWFPVLV